jgi:malic enzyme
VPLDPLPRHRYVTDEKGAACLEVPAGGFALIENPLLNKGMAFDAAEREELGLTGLLPPRVVTLEQQAERVLWTFQRQESDLERYLHMMGVLERNETLFYRILVDRFPDLLPVVYTPTVGLACQNYGRIFRRARGLFVTPEDQGRLDQVLARWRYPNVRVVVVTDGERVLGLGDLGAGGMGISVGKASLYVAGAGFHPAQVLPVCLDVGTDNAALRSEPLYLGIDRPRLRGEAYDRFVDAFLEAVSRQFPHAVIQFEDFASTNALSVLERHRDARCCFNDDVQGTGAIARAALAAGLRGTGRTLQGLRVVIAGAGSAGVGIAGALKDADVWVTDERGLLTPDRPGLLAAQRALTREGEGATLLDVVRRVRPHALIGVTGVPGLFTRAMIEAMEGPHPLVLPLSNPTTHAECTPAQAIEWSGGLARVATGSPFPDTAQCNNVYVFPGVGLGVVAADARRVSDGMFHAAAEAVAALSPPDRLLPPLQKIREVSLAVALAVAQAARAEGLARVGPRADLAAKVRDLVWEPRYVRYRLRGLAPAT